MITKPLVSRMGRYIYILVVIFFLCGCKTKYLPMETVVYREKKELHTDTLWNTDSIRIHDSVVVERRGDTVFLERWHTKLKYQYVYKVKADTLFSVDTVRVKVPLVKEKTKYDSFVQGLCKFISISSVLALLVICIFKKIKIWVKR